MSFQHVASIDPSTLWNCSQSHREKAARLHPEPRAVTP